VLSGSVKLTVVVLRAVRACAWLRSAAGRSAVGAGAGPAGGPASCRCGTAPLMGAQVARVGVCDRVLGLWGGSKAAVAAGLGAAGGHYLRRWECACRLRGPAPPRQAAQFHSGVGLGSGVCAACGA